jgi:hypothetical protein
MIVGMRALTHASPAKGSASSHCPNNWHCAPPRLLGAVVTVKPWHSSPPAVHRAQHFSTLSMMASSAAMDKLEVWSAAGHAAVGPGGAADVAAAAKTMWSRSATIKTTCVIASIRGAARMRGATQHKELSSL